MIARPVVHGLVHRSRAFWGALTGDPETYRLLDIGVLITAGLLSFIFFARVAAHAADPSFQSDLQEHAVLLGTIESSGSTPYSIWYLLQEAVIGRNRDTAILLASGWLMLGALAAFKGIVLTGVLMATTASRRYALVMGLLLGMAVALPIPFLVRHSRLFPDPIRYLGTLPPNVFWSATQLLANITAVAAVVTITLWYQKPTTVRLVSMSSMALVATLAKPGIAPAFLAAVALLAVLAVRARRLDIRTAVVVVVATGLLVGLPLLVAYQGFMSGTGFKGTHAVFRPFDTWTTYTSQWLPDLLASWAFPIVAVVALWATRDAAGSRPDWLLPAWSVTAVATLMFALLGEADGSGRALYSGNFAWGAMAATSALYAVSAIAVWEVRWRIRWLPLTVLAVQAAAGLLYVRAYIETGRFV